MKNAIQSEIIKPPTANGQKAGQTMQNPPERPKLTILLYDSKIYSKKSRVRFPGPEILTPGG